MVEGLTRDAENLEFSYCSVDEYVVVEKSLGDPSGGATPGPIPNPVVKPASADGTWGEAPWESRSLPGGFFFVLRALFLARAARLCAPLFVALDALSEFADTLTEILAQLAQTSYTEDEQYDHQYDE
jgi:hypothetical protein